MWPSLWPDAVATADSLAALAARMNIPADVLQAEIERYNGFVDAGSDEDFGKPGPLHKIQRPPFYAARLIGIRHTSRNGIRVNSKAQVLDIAGTWVRGAGGVQSVDEEPIIPRLYAAGEITDTLGWRRHHGSVGVYVLMALTAGRNAAAEPVD